MNFNNYKNKKNYPVKPKKPNSSNIENREEALEFADKIDKWNKQMEIFRKEIEEWREEERKLLCKFEYDLLKEFGLENHPKKEKIFSYCWEKGHSFGLNEVYNEMIDLYELFKD